ncbi:MAG: prolipoprotein diacylglyceryl transferase [Hyphomicrobiaceae bacterium]|nr:prolipoprotein diacylglyceryl transferase [Hyphomicrobiaceae bacterium]
MTVLAALAAIPFPAFDPVAIEIGPIAIRWYGLAYAAGLLLGWLYIRRLLATPALWPRSSPPMQPDDVDELLVFVTLGVVVGGRLGHILFYEPAHYLAHPLEVFAIWKGGMAFHGGLVGTAIAMLLYARRRGVSVWPVMDVVAAAVPIGLLFGRLANFVNGEIVGSPTDMPWGMVFPGWGSEPRHPAMLYEAALEGIALFALLRYATHTQGTLKLPGLTTGLFLVGYAAFRIFCELFKFVDYRMLHPDLPVTKGMVYSLPMLLVGIWFVIAARRRAAEAAA